MVKGQTVRGAREAARIVAVGVREPVEGWLVGGAAVNSQQGFDFFFLWERSYFSVGLCLTHGEPEAFSRSLSLSLPHPCLGVEAHDRLFWCSNYYCLEGLVRR